MWFADDVARALLTVRRPVGEVIVGQALVAEDAGAFKHREKEARKPAHVDLVGSGSADRIVVRKFDVGELHIPVILELVDHHCQHLGHRVIHTLHSTIAIWVVGADGNFPNPKKLVDRLLKL